MLLDSEGIDAVTSDGSDDHCIFTFNVFGQTSQTVTFVKGGLERYLMTKVKIKILFKITFVAKVVF